MLYVHIAIDDISTLVVVSHVSNIAHDGDGDYMNFCRDQRQVDIHIRNPMLHKDFHVNECDIIVD